MIYIEEKTTSKVPGETSLYIKIEYNPTYIAFLKTLSGYAYHEKTHIWELPTIYLSRIIDELCVYDSIDFTSLSFYNDFTAMKEWSSYLFMLRKLVGDANKPWTIMNWDSGAKNGMSHFSWVALRQECISMIWIKVVPRIYTSFFKDVFYFKGGRYDEKNVKWN